jgi:hypothetical protein
MATYYARVNLKFETFMILCCLILLFLPWDILCMAEHLFKWYLHYGKNRPWL